MGSFHAGEKAFLLKVYIWVLGYQQLLSPQSFCGRHLHLEGVKQSPKRFSPQNSFHNSRTFSPSKVLGLKMEFITSTHDLKKGFEHKQSFDSLWFMYDLVIVFPQILVTVIPVKMEQHVKGLVANNTTVYAYQVIVE